MKIRCLIIDDEPSSQSVLENFIENVDFLELSGICNNAIEALKELNKNHIDLLFLDINMPKISGLTFYKSLQNPPDVIFTTAYSQHAIDGFEVNATDYLLKPFSFDRFFTAVNKVVEKKHSNNKTNNIDYILIKANKITHKITTNDILFIEAYGDYVKVHIEDKFILTNSTFTNIFNQLPKNLFFRTHKSFAVNLDKIDTINGNRISISKHLVPIGQKFKSEFLKSLNKS
ncbi:MAG: response regulator transcription factor [Flavobacteriaceae bacterium]|nr:response regulator transcription factor [Flavobacteriaceae bacterium]